MLGVLHAGKVPQELPKLFSGVPVTKSKTKTKQTSKHLKTIMNATLPLSPFQDLGDFVDLATWWLGNCRLNCAWPVNCISIVMPSAVCRCRLSLHVARPIEGCNCNKTTPTTTTTTYRQQQQRHLTSARVPCECLADESCSSAHSHCKVIQESDKKKYCKKLHYISALTSWLSKCVCLCV